MSAIERNGKFVGVEIDGYFIYFNGIEGEFIKEDDEGNYFVETDIYKLDPKTNKETCKVIKKHKKLDGTKVPEKK